MTKPVLIVPRSSPVQAWVSRKGKHAESHTKYLSEEISARLRSVRINTAKFGSKCLLTSQAFECENLFYYCFFSTFLIAFHLMCRTEQYDPHFVITEGSERFEWNEINHFHTPKGKLCHFNKEMAAAIRCWGYFPHFGKYLTSIAENL